MNDVENDDWQCKKVADVEYGQEIRCSAEAGHDGECRL